MAVRERGTAGFSLVETVVAFAIAALSMLALFQAGSDGLRGLRGSEGRMMALLEAQSLLDSIGNNIPIENGTFEGTTDQERRWNVTMTALTSAETVDSSSMASRLVPYRVEIAVEVGGSAPVVLRTVRLGPVP